MSELFSRCDECGVVLPYPLTMCGWCLAMLQEEEEGRIR